MRKKVFPQLAKGWKVFFVSAIFVLLNLTLMASEAPQYSSRTWQAEDGLPNRTVQAIVQTRDGYLWVGTQYGLARFDGTEFTVFNVENAPVMRNANILGLHESRDGSLWAATGSGGVLRLQGSKFVHYGKAEGLASAYTRGPIVESRDGALWFGTVAGLSRFKDGVFTSFTVTNGLSNDVVRDLCEYSEGNLWIATGGGVDCRFKDGSIRRAPSTEEFKGTDVRAICCGPDVTVWFGAGNRLNRVQNGHLTTFVQGRGLSYNIITELFLDRRGNLWVGSYGGLSRFTDGEFTPQLGSDGLPFDLVTAVFEDREGNLWVGSRDGLTQLRADQFRTYTQQEGLRNNNVMSVLEDHSGAVWLGTWGGGLSQIIHGIVSPYTNSAETPVLALALHEDRAGQLWAGTDFGGGLFRLNGDALQRFGTKQGLPDQAIRVIYEDRETNLWVGTSGGLYQAKGGRFRAFGKQQGLGAVVVREILEDRAGNLWVGTLDGLWRFGQEGVAKFAETNGLTSNAVIALYEDGAGQLWIGTAGGGLNRLHDGKLAAVTSKQGLFNNTICEILEDDLGWLWMSCPRGVFRVQRCDLESVAQGAAPTVSCVTYGKVDGMLSELCNGVAKPGAWKSRDGRLWFATSKGVCVTDPQAQTNKDSSAPIVVLERVLADKQPFPAEETVPLTGPIRVPPGRGEIEFHYAALSFRAPERNRYKYQLEGVNPDWIEAGPRRTAYYHHIGPGTYRFHVIACGNNGIWNQTGAAVDLVLLPQIWQTWWFRLGLVAGVGLVIVGLQRYRGERAREIERLRLRLAADLHDDVGSNLSTIALLSRRVQKEGEIRHAAKEDLAAIHRISQQTANAVREIVWLINPEYDTFPDLVLRMKEAATAILAGLEVHFHAPPADLPARLSLQFRQNLFLLYKETLTNIARHARATRVDIDLAAQENTWRLTIRDNGTGFDPASVRRGNGLKNLRLRATRLKGDLQLESRPGSGTVVTFSVKHS
jgi:ligand-binding sensor domain-containing protein